MKKIILLVSLMMLVKCGWSQNNTYSIAADSTRLYSKRLGGQGNELKLENSTKSVTGVLVNIGNGVSRWKEVVQVDDTTFVIADDTVRIRGIGSGGGGGTADRFGIEDNLGIQNRLVNMEGYNFEMDSLGYYKLISGDISYTNATADFTLQPNSAAIYAQNGLGQFSNISVVGLAAELDAYDGNTNSESFLKLFSDGTAQAKGNLDSSTDAAPNVLGIDVDGNWHRYNPNSIGQRFGIEDPGGVQGRDVDMSGFYFDVYNAGYAELAISNNYSFYNLQRGNFFMDTAGSGQAELNGYTGAFAETNIQYGNGVDTFLQNMLVITAYNSSFYHQVGVTGTFTRIPFVNNYLVASITDGSGTHTADSLGNVDISGGGGGTDFNFAEDNLTATGDRYHNFKGYDFIMDSVDEYFIQSKVNGNNDLFAIQNDGGGNSFVYGRWSNSDNTANAEFNANATDAHIGIDAAAGTAIVATNIADASIDINSSTQIIRMNPDSLETPQNILWKDNDNVIHIAALPTGGGSGGRFAYLGEDNTQGESRKFILDGNFSHNFEISYDDGAGTNDIFRIQGSGGILLNSQNTNTESLLSVERENIDLSVYDIATANGDVVDVRQHGRAVLSSYQGFTVTDYVSNPVITDLYADPSAVLDVRSAYYNKGVLLPRMATSDRTGISSPHEALIVYDSTLHNYYFYNGTIWVAMSGGGGGGSARFGYAGEDDVAGEPRDFDANNNTFKVHNSTHIYFETPYVVSTIPETSIDLAGSTMLFQSNSSSGDYRWMQLGSVETFIETGTGSAISNLAVGNEYISMRVDDGGSNTIIARVLPTRFTLLDASETNTTARTRLNIGATQNFASNAAAVTGGLGVGDVYRNGDVLQVVH